MGQNANETMRIDMKMLAQADRQASVKVDNFQDLQRAVESIFRHGVGVLLVGQIRRHAGEIEQLLAVEGPPSPELIERLSILLISGFLWGWRYRQLEQDQENDKTLVSYTVENFMEC